ncbi:acetolactate synthase 2 regulatory subunit [Ectothiorhodospira sp. PHS-1]|uniref:ACT domain-containing protein n=1 Tax=Ectothiorhodospira sp. PHS-1 TaxID=519989 RepID=UPI00024A86BB|nr:ACT domain-containing protein [Ectothiorhodospira sp. PHS-1]EHQ51777.1 acetolactate synthase 2 regulatory subunit [Ectothiorhodospira sp. PHS-1]
MSHQFQLFARPAEGSLERILRTVRARGFEVQDMNVRLEGGRYHVRLRVGGRRDTGMLARQLEKLWDVEHLAALQAAPEARESMDRVSAA